MKYGVRKPNIKKSIKARTTGKVKRQVKRRSIPFMVKREWESSTTRKRQHITQCITELPSACPTSQRRLTAANGNPAASSSTNAPQKKEYSANTYSVCGILMIVLGAVLALLGLILLLAVPVAGIIAIVFGVACVVIGRKYRKVAKERRANE